MSNNIRKIEQAKELVRRMHRFIRLFEKGQIGDGDFTAPLSPAQVTAIKQSFVSARTACISALNDISAS